MVFETYPSPKRFEICLAKIGVEEIEDIFLDTIYQDEIVDILKALNVDLVKLYQEINNKIPSKHFQKYLDRTVHANDLICNRISQEPYVIPSPEVNEITTLASREAKKAGHPYYFSYRQYLLAFLVKKGTLCDILENCDITYSKAEKIING